MRATNRIIVTVVLALALSATLSLAQEKMTMEEYNKQLAGWQERLQNAEKAKVECAAQNEELQQKIDAAQAESDQVWKEILAAIGVDQDAVNAYRAELKALNAQCDELLAMSPEALMKKRGDIKAMEAKLQELKKNRIAALTEMQDLIALIEGKLLQLKTKMPANYDEYTVVRGDYLWKISGKKEGYGDPTQWMRIFSFNTDQIKEPNLIQPNWVLKIQREAGQDEYVVVKGDYLKKIAAKPEVFGDPAKWKLIYEKNKGAIGDDPNLIVPSTVLVIPKD